MGCFLGCFGGSKRHKNAHIAHVPLQNANLGNQYNPIHETVASKQDLIEESINLPVIESRIEPDEKKLSLANQHKQEEQLNLGVRKRVTFDSNVKEYEHVSCNEAPEILEEREIGVNVDITKPDKSFSSSESGSTSSSLVSFPPNHRYQNCRESDDEVDDLDYIVSDLDEDDEDEDEHDDDDDDDDYHKEAYNDEYSDDEYCSGQVPEISTISCSSMESGTKSSTTCGVNDRHDGDRAKDNGSLDKETNTPPVFYRGARDRTGYVHSVLNPVENTAQWKNVKVKQTPSMKYQKENFQMDLGFSQSSLKSKSKLDEPENTCEVAVDASLSTWLDSSQKTPPNKPTPIGLEPISSVATMSSHGSNSVRLKEERPMLGALTMEELKQFSATSSPRKSPSRTPNEMSSQGSNSVRIREGRPILGALTMEELKQFSATSPRKSPSPTPNEKPLVGTVGIHWNNRNDRTPVEDSTSSSSFKGIPNTTSKYREDKRVTWHSTPFETRLERALNRDAADSRT